MKYFGDKMHSLGINITEETNCLVENQGIHGKYDTNIFFLKTTFRPLDSL